jgi:hypothetical protein
MPSKIAIKRRGASGLVIDAKAKIIAEYGNTIPFLLSKIEQMVPVVTRNVYNAVSNPQVHTRINEVCVARRSAEMN